MTTPGNQATPDPGTVTRVLGQLRGGVSGAEEELFDLIHGELRRLAGAYMARERSDHTLQPTALVNEAYVRLMGSGKAPWEDRAHFLRSAAKVMRRILVDAARTRAAKKRGGNRPKVTFDEGMESNRTSPEELLAVHDALKKLEDFSPNGSRIVELRFFGGLTLDEIADVLDMSKRTVCREWEAARLWLYREIAA